MSFIAQRLNLDMLTMSGSFRHTLAAQGIDAERDTEFMALVEPDTIRDAYRLAMAAGAEILVTATEGITPARLAHHRMEDRLEELAVAALTVARMVSPQHVLVEVAPCGLPLDAASAPSLKEYREQYVRVARAFEACGAPDPETGATAFDGYLLGGFTSVAALKAACAGVRKVSDKALFVSVDVDGEGRLLPRGAERVEDAAAAAVEFGADVVGFATAAAPAAAAAVARRIAAVADVPLAVEFRVAAGVSPYASPDSLYDAALELRRAGVQFMRAGGDASPAHTAVLAAAVAGLDVVGR